jgi:hypothetical protein
MNPMMRFSHIIASVHPSEAMFTVPFVRVNEGVVIGTIDDVEGWTVVVLVDVVVLTVVVVVLATVVVFAVFVGGVMTA